LCWKPYYIILKDINNSYIIKRLVLVLDKTYLRLLHEGINSKNMHT